MPLVEIDQEHNVVPEAGHPVGGGHGDDKGEQVVNEGVKCLVHDSSPGNDQSIDTLDDDDKLAMEDEPLT